MSHLRMIARIFGQSVQPPHRVTCEPSRQALIESLEHRLVLNAATPAASWSDVYNDKTLPPSAITQAPTPAGSDIVTPTQPLFTFTATPQGLPPVKSPGSPIGAPPVYLPEPAELTLLGMCAMLILRRRRRLEAQPLALDISSKR